MNYVTKIIPSEKPRVAFGNCQQDDIKRYADDYSREASATTNPSDTP